jgi:hypothetical protein
MDTTSTKLDHYPGATYIPSMGNAAAMANADDDKYIVTTKIMVLALSVLFAVVFFVICLHIYAKWMWGASTPGSRAPASFWLWPARWRRVNSASETVLDADTLDINLVVGLGKAAVEALPTFRYKTEAAAVMECAICMGEFQEGELCRSLPKCAHSFHLECIDMWLFSHSTCPLCRAVLEPDEDDSISLNLESSSIQVFHVSTPRRLQLPSDQHNILEAAAAAEQPNDEHETANKRADSIPANVLFWGNLMPHEFRVVNNAIAIDIDSPSSRSHGTIPAPANSFASF